MSYDLYLHTACRAQPELDDLLASIPDLGTPALQAKLRPYPPPARGVFQPHPPTPGFLGLGLEEAQADVLLARLTAVRAQGKVLLAAYRQPRITPEQALRIAEPELQRICQEQHPTLHYEPVRLWKEEPHCWVFFTLSRELQEQGWIPGGPMIRVDKLDGHLF